jgi:hypothetical protein
MRDKNIKIDKDITNEQIIIIKKLFKEGHHLDEICQRTKLDIDTVLNEIRKFKYKKNTLYIIYELQESNKTNKKIRKEIRKRLVDKFFPICNDESFFTYSYHLYFMKKSKETEEKRKNCTHRLKHVRCGICGKIICDATHLEID